MLCAGLLCGFSSHIWQIQITGNYQNTTPAIRRYLSEMEVSVGMPRKALDCQKIAAAIREEFPSITWVSAKIQGSRLLVSVRENETVSDKDSREETPCDLIASRQGKIVSIITRQGTPLKKAGETCEKGEVLVSAAVPIQNDSQEIVRYEYVKADADVILEYSLNYREEFPLTYRQRVYASKEKHSYALRIGSFRLGAAVPRARDCQDLVADQLVLAPTKGFARPILLERYTLRTYETATRVYTEEEAREKASLRLQKTLEKFLEKGLEISRNDVKITVDENSCISEGILAVRGEASQERPVTEFTQPEEREQKE